MGDQKYDVVPGTAFIYRDSNPTVRYFYPDDADEPWQFIWINFLGETTAEWISAINDIYGYFFEHSQGISCRRNFMCDRTGSDRQNKTDTRKNPR